MDELLLDNNIDHLNKKTNDKPPSKDPDTIDSCVTPTTKISTMNKTTVNITTPPSTSLSTAINDIKIDNKTFTTDIVMKNLYENDKIMESCSLNKNDNTKIVNNDNKDIENLNDLSTLKLPTVDELTQHNSNSSSNSSSSSNNSSSSSSTNSSNNSTSNSGTFFSNNNKNNYNNNNNPVIIKNDKNVEVKSDKKDHQLSVEDNLLKNIECSVIGIIGSADINEDEESIENIERNILLNDIIENENEMIFDDCNIKRKLDNKNINNVELAADGANNKANNLEIIKKLNECTDNILYDIMSNNSSEQLSSGSTSSSLKDKKNKTSVKRKQKITTEKTSKKDLVRIEKIKNQSETNKAKTLLNKTTNLKVKTTTIIAPTQIAKSLPPSALKTTKILSSTAMTTPSAPIKTIKSVNFANGTLPKSGKPLMAAINKKMKRGRPKRKALVAMYQSQLNDKHGGIKICIKKSDLSPAKRQSTNNNNNNNNRKRSRKTKSQNLSDSEDTDHEKKKRKTSIKIRAANYNNNNYNDDEPQSPWGETIPRHILYKIFQQLINDAGTLPTIVHLGHVCSLWRAVSLSPSLWQTVELSQWTKERQRTELNLKWFIENRLSLCTDLNLSNWKITNTQCVLDILIKTCTNLTSLTLTGWKSLTSDHLLFIVENLKNLKRIDLSSINMEMNSSKCAVSMMSLCNSLQAINSRLTHLYLQNNRLAGLPNLVTALSANCPNLILLDLSNIRTLAASHIILFVEKLQVGCPNLKVLRITNSQIALSSVTLQEQMDSPGFPELEELSAASLNDNRLIDDGSLKRILKTSTKLKLLDVRGSKLTHDSLIRLPTWDLKHLFLSGCSITRESGAGLELIASKWAHSLIELDLAWANVETTLDNALRALAEKGSESLLSHINLCGSSVSIEMVRELLKNCRNINSINLSSCRSLPRGVKRLLQGKQEIKELCETLGVILPEDNVLTNNNNNDKEITSVNEMAKIPNTNEPSSSAAKATALTSDKELCTTITDVLTSKSINDNSLIDSELKINEILLFNE